MDRTLKGELYAQAHRDALEHFRTIPSDEEPLDELTSEYYNDSTWRATHDQQAQLEISSSEDNSENNSGANEAEPNDEQSEEDDTPDEDITA